MIEAPLSLATVIAAATGLAFWLDYRFEAVGKVGASMLAIIFGTVLSNVGLVPVSSPVYGAIGGVVTSLAIAWLLLSVDLRDLRKAGPRMIGAFGIAVTGTALGAMVGALIYQDRFGDNTWRLAGTLTGTYSGGSVNFVSVGRAFEIPDVLFAGATAADNMATGIWLAVTLMLPVWLGRFYPAPASAGHSPASDPGSVEARGEDGDAPGDRSPQGGGAAATTGQSERHAHHPYFAHVGMSALQIANLMAVGLLLVFTSEWLGGLVPGVPAILWLTTLALILGHTPLYREAPGALQMGSVALHFFFVLIGILSRFSEIVTVGIEVFFFTLIVVGVHGVVVYGAGKLFRLDIATLSVASQAAVGGPSSALAVAISREWRHLVLPAVIVGLLGYAVGTYLGLGVGYAARALL